MTDVSSGRFRWNREKAKENLVKHGVSFREASSVFDDEDQHVYPDGKHSYHEDRFTIIGKSKKSRIIMVCHCYREIIENTKKIQIIRIFSARKANDFETKVYKGEELYDADEWRE